MLIIDIIIIIIMFFLILFCYLIIYEKIEIFLENYKCEKLKNKIKKEHEELIRSIENWTMQFNQNKNP